jgi:hypothetical protein
MDVDYNSVDTGGLDPMAELRRRIIAGLPVVPLNGGSAQPSSPAGAAETAATPSTPPVMLSGATAQPNLPQPKVQLNPAPSLGMPPTPTVPLTNPSAQPMKPGWPQVQQDDQRAITDAQQKAASVKPGFLRHLAAMGLGAAAGFGGGGQVGAEVAQKFLNRPKVEAEQAVTDAESRAKADQSAAVVQAGLEKEAAETREANARAAQLENPPEKDKTVTPEEQAFSDLLKQTNPETGKPYTAIEAYRAVRTAGATPKEPKENKAVSGTLNGQPAWGVQTDKGWVDPQTQQAIPNFKPAPSFAETGLYEPVEVPLQGGGMAPGVFDKRTGRTSVTAPTSTPIPKEAQKPIEEALGTARGMDRLESAQRQILQGVEKRGDMGIAGGGPYLNGPESMQFVANHIAMTFGAVKGARVGRDIIEQHIKARDLDQSVEAAAQKVLSGGVITYSQAQQMMDTAKINRKSAWQQAQAAATQYGVPDAVKLPQDLAPGRDLGAAPKGKAEGSTGTMPDGTKVVVRKGRIVTQ